MAAVGCASANAEIQDDRSNASRECLLKHTIEFYFETELESISRLGESCAVMAGLLHWPKGSGSMSRERFLFCTVDDHPISQSDPVFLAKIEGVKQSLKELMFPEIALIKVYPNWPS